MTIALVESAQVAKKPKQSKQSDAIRDRVDLRADPEWIARVLAQAKRFEQSISAYIRQAVTEKLEQDEQSDPKKKSS